MVPEPVSGGQSDITLGRTITIALSKEPPPDLRLISSFGPARVEVTMAPSFEPGASSSSARARHPHRRASALPWRYLGQDTAERVDIRLRAVDARLERLGRAPRKRAHKAAAGRSRCRGRGHVRAARAPKVRDLAVRRGWWVGETLRSGNVRKVN